MPNNSQKLRELLGDDIVFFNKIDKKPEHREQALEHMDDCVCNVCKVKALKLRLDKRFGG